MGTIKINSGSGTPVTINKPGSTSNVTINREVMNMYVLDGVDDYITIPQTTLDFAQTSAQSYEIWFKLSSVGAQKTILSLYNPATSKGTRISVSSTKYLTFTMRNVSEILEVNCNEADNSGTDQIVVPLRWYHLVVTYSGSGATGVKFYIDGKPLLMTVVSDTLDSSPENNSNILFGTDADLASFTQMDVGVTRVFSKELSQGEVTTLYNSGLPLISTSISNKVFEILLDDSFNGTNYVVRDSANSVNGVGNMPEVALQDMDINLLIRNGNQPFVTGKLVYNTFGLSGDTGVDIYDSPLGDRRYSNIFYDSSSGRTYMCWQQRPYLGGSRQSMALYIDHAGQFATPSYPAGYISPGGYDNHMLPALTVTADNEILLVHENLHNSPIYVKKTSGKNLSTFSHVATMSQILGAYPALVKIGSDLFCIIRNGPGTGLLRDYITKSTTNGATWGTTKYLLTMNNSTGTDRAYFDVIYHPTKIILLLRMREDAVDMYLSIFWIESTDGVTWTNITGTWTHNIDTEDQISRAELDTNCIVRESLTTDVYIKGRTLVNGNMIGFGNEGEDEYIFIWWDGDSWNTKPINLPNFTPASSIGNQGRGDGWPIHAYDDQHIILWRLETRGGFDVVVQYETFDQCDTFDAGTIISDTDKHHQHLNGTTNHSGSDKMILACNQITGVNGNTNLWMYEFTPTLD